MQFIQVMLFKLFKCDLFQFLSAALKSSLTKLLQSEYGTIIWTLCKYKVKEKQITRYITETENYSDDDDFVEASK